MIRAPFDPIAALAAEFHDDAHRVDQCASHPAACPLSVAFATAIRERLAARGLVVAPQTVIEWATRMLDEADRVGAVEAVPSPAATDSERRIREVVWVRLRHPVAPPTRLGPYERWPGELVLGDIGFSHGPDVIGAVIEPEGAWIGELMGSLEL